MPILANVIEDAFSPLISLFESIMVFIHAHLVGGWGLAIVGLTVVIRAVLVPLTFRQLKSMQEMQRLAPQINALKEKYKDDKQRQQQEIMKFYQENKINPLASCLPLLLQLPVFISLFYMLRTDLKLDICGAQQMRTLLGNCSSRRSTENSEIPGRDRVMRHARSKAFRKSAATPFPPRASPSPRLGEVPVPARHHLQGDGRGADRADRAVRRLAGRLDARGDGHGRSQPAPADAAAAAGVRGDPLPLSGRVCWCTGSRRTCGRSASSI